MHDCDQIRPLLALRAEDWSAEAGTRVETHLAHCETCAALREAYLEQDRLIRGLPAVELTSTQRAEVWSRIRGLKQDARGIVFLGLNVASALSTAFTLVILTANLLFASPPTILPDLPVPTAPVPSPAVVPDSGQRIDMALQQSEPSEPTPVPAPSPGTADQVQTVTDRALDHDARYSIVVDPKELA